MSKLIRYELFKVFRQKKLYVFMLILTAVEIAAVFQYGQGGTGLAAAQPNGQSFPLLLLNTGTLFIPIFIAILAADSIAEEYRGGTLKTVLLCPIDRVELLLAKIASLFVTAAALHIFLLLSAYTVGTLAFGWGDQTFAGGTAYTTMEGIGLVARASLLSLLPELAFGMVVIFAALLTTNTGASIGSALALMAVSPMIEGIPQIRHFFIGYQMRVFPFHAVNHATSLEAWTGLAVILAYIGILYAGSVMILKKKDILI